jgi:hypothetical protein
MRAYVVGWLIVVCLAVPGAAQGPLEVDQAEVLRLGDVVQHVGGGPRSAEIDNYVEALGPPARDADKWFVSVLTRQGCAACEQLKREWGRDPWLLALANPADPGQSWAHYNVYSREDRSQAFRFEGIQVTAFPTVVVQPPRSGKYGDPKSVVFQGVYGGDPQKLVEAIARSIRQYVGKLSVRQSLAVVRSQAERGTEDTGPGALESDAATHGIDPPWQPPAKDQPMVGPSRTPFGPADGMLQIIPPPQQVPAFPWAALISLLSAGLSLPTAIAMVIWTIYFIRARRQAAGKPPIVEPQTLERILEVLKGIAESGGSRPKV